MAHLYEGQKVVCFRSGLNVQLKRNLGKTRQVVIRPMQLIPPRRAKVNQLRVTCT